MSQPEFAALASRVQAWLAGYTLPPLDSPLFPVEEANLGILRYFLAVLAVASENSTDPVQAGRQHLRDFPDFPRQGHPSAALRILGVARPDGPLVDLQDRLLDSFSAEQRALVVLLSGPG